MSGMLHVGNLPPSTTERALFDRFRRWGNVVSVQILTDQHTGRSLGLARVEMGSDREARRAIENLDGADYDGCFISVAEDSLHRQVPRGIRVRER